MNLISAARFFVVLVFVSACSQQQNKKTSVSSLSGKSVPTVGGSAFGFNYWPQDESMTHNIEAFSDEYYPKLKQRVRQDLDFISSLNGKVIRMWTGPGWLKGYEISEGKGGRFTEDFGEITRNLQDYLRMLKDRDMYVVFGFANGFRNYGPSKDLKWWQQAYGTDFNAFLKDSATWMMTYINSIESSPYKDRVIFYDLENEVYFGEPRTDEYVAYMLNNVKFPVGKKGISVLYGAPGWKGHVSDVDILREKFPNEKFDYIDFHTYPYSGFQADIVAAFDNVKKNYPQTKILLGEFSVDKGSEENPNADADTKTLLSKIDSREFLAHMHWMLQKSPKNENDLFGITNSNLMPKPNLAALLDRNSFAKNPSFETADASGGAQFWSGGGWVGSNSSGPVISQSLQTGDSALGQKYLRSKFTETAKTNLGSGKGALWIVQEISALPSSRLHFNGYMRFASCDMVSVDIHEYDESGSEVALGHLPGIKSEGWTWQSYSYFAAEKIYTLGAKTSKINLAIVGTGCLKEAIIDLDSVSVSLSVSGLSPVRPGAPDNGPQPTPAPTPVPSGPIILNSGTGCDDGYCVWIQAQKISPDVVVEIFPMGKNGATGNYSQGQRTYTEQKDFTSITLRLTPQNILDLDGGGISIQLVTTGGLRSNKIDISRSGPQPTSTPSTDVVFVSDMDFKSESNGFGPVERDMSNGESSSKDGQLISINRVKHQKGLGVHASSEVKVALDGKFSQFLAEVGLDDEIGGKGTVVFEVWADGAKLFDSGKVSGSTSKSISVNVSGKIELTLKVTDAGDGIGYDHGDWGSARLLKGGDLPPTTPSPTPTPNPKKLKVWMYAYDISGPDVDVLDSWGLPGLMDYTLSSDTKNRVLKTKNMKIVYPVYFHDGGGCATSLGKKDSQMTESDFELCLERHKSGFVGAMDRLEALYLFDEPELEHHTFSLAQQAAAVRAANKVFPGVPTYIAYYEDDAKSPMGLSYRGIQLYDVKDKDPSRAKGIFATNRKHTLDPNTQLITIIRTFSGGRKIDNDDQLADFNRKVIDTARNYPDMGGIMWYIWNGTKELPGLQYNLKTQDVVRTTIGELAR